MNQLTQLRHVCPNKAFRYQTEKIQNFDDKVTFKETSYQSTAIIIMTQRPVKIVDKKVSENKFEKNIADADQIDQIATDYYRKNQFQITMRILLDCNDTYHAGYISGIWSSLLFTARLDLQLIFLSPMSE